MSHSPTDRRKPTVRLLAIGLAALLAGCASVDPAPFTQFAAGVTNLGKAIDVEAKADYEAERKLYLSKAKDMSYDPFIDLRLQFFSTVEIEGNKSLGLEVKGTGTQEKEEGEHKKSDSFLTAGEFRAGLKALNDAVANYATMLARLAGKETVSDADFDLLAKKLDSEATSAIAAVQNKTGDQGPDLGLFSQAVTTAFRGYIEKKRRKGLSEEIKRIQPQIESFSRVLQEAADQLAFGIRVNYGKQFNALLNDPESYKKILELNQKTEKRLQALAAVWDGYGGLPKAHNALAEAADKRPRGLSGFLEFTDEALRLQQLSAAATAETE